MISNLFSFSYIMIMSYSSISCIEDFQNYYHYSDSILRHFGNHWKSNSKKKLDFKLNRVFSIP